MNSCSDSIKAATFSLLICLLCLSHTDFLPSIVWVVGVIYLGHLVWGMCSQDFLAADLMEISRTSTWTQTGLHCQAAVAVVIYYCYFITIKFSYTKSKFGNTRCSKKNHHAELKSKLGCPTVLTRNDLQELRWSDSENILNILRILLASACQMSVQTQSLGKLPFWTTTPRTEHISQDILGHKSKKVMLNIRT